jgi:hypothetical protein
MAIEIMLKWVFRTTIYEFKKVLAMFRHSPIRSLVYAGLFCICSLHQTENAAAMTGLRLGNKIAFDMASPEGAHPILVELFTAEGCSSCPPADALLLKMDTSQPVPGAQLIVLSEHVDYWDHDGWKDPNSSRALTERQAAYVQALGLKTPYTPQLIVDGSHEMLINNSEQTIKVFQNAVAEPKLQVSLAEVSVDSNDSRFLRVHVYVNNDDESDADVYVAVALDRVESEVLRGENKNKHLTHVAVVQQLEKIGNIQKGKTFAGDVQLRLKPGVDIKNGRVVAFVQERGPGKVLGAAMKKSAP